MALRPHGFIPVVHAATDERPDEIDTIIAAEAVALALAELGFVTDIVAVGLDASEIEALKGRNPSLVFNLVDAVKGDGRLAPEVPAMLDKARAALYRRRRQRLARHSLQARDQEETRRRRARDTAMVVGWTGVRS